MLEQIDLENFKRFRKVSIPVAGLTVLMGVNGSGKSTLIQSILVARQSLDSAALDEGFLALSGDLAQVGIGKDALFDGAGTDELITIKFRQADKSVSLSAKYDAKSDRLKLAAPASLKNFGSIGASTFAYLSAERWGPRLSTPVSEAAAASARLGKQGEGTVAVLEHKRDDKLEEGDPRLLPNLPNSIWEQTQGYLSEISPGARIDVERHDRLDSVSASITYVGEGGVRTAPFRTTNVGFGISYSLPIIVACLTSQKGSILIVENPEAHLHTLGQRKMAELLARTAEAGVQIFIETHSREIFYKIRNCAKNSEYLSNNSALHYFSANASGSISSLLISSLLPIHADLKDWPSEFFDAFGSPTDLVVPR